MTARPARRRGLAALALLAALGFAWLGVWQVQRRAWKLDLIARVDARLAAAAVPVPGPARWPAIDARTAEYRKVRATGRFLPCRTRLVQAVTALGPGHWVMTPMATTGGFTLFVNRGFLPQDRPAEPCAGARPPLTTVSGLLRLNEPGGAFLRHNDARASRWFSRDVVAMGRGLPRVALYFVDAEANGRGWPRGGLTVIRFRNNHLVYAITWFALAAVAMTAVAILLRPEGRY